MIDGVMLLFIASWGYAVVYTPAYPLPALATRAACHTCGGRLAGAPKLPSTIVLGCGGEVVVWRQIHS